MFSVEKERGLHFPESVSQKVMVQCVAPTVAMETNMREFSHVFMW